MYLNIQAEELIKSITKNPLASKEIGKTGILPEFVFKKQKEDIGRYVLFFRLSSGPLAHTEKLKEMFGDMFDKSWVDSSDITHFGYDIFVVNFPWWANRKIKSN